MAVYPSKYNSVDLHPLLVPLSAACVSIPKIQLCEFTFFPSAVISDMWFYHGGSPLIVEILTY